MNTYKLVNLLNHSEVNKMNSNSKWHKCLIIPYYREVFACFTQNDLLSYEELLFLFLNKNDDDQIGAISAISEKYPYRFYESICDNPELLSQDKADFLLDYVLHDYLPLFIPKELILFYDFEAQYSDDIWVKILQVVKSRVNK